MKKAAKKTVWQRCFRKLFSKGNENSEKKLCDNAERGK